MLRQIPYRQLLYTKSGYLLIILKCFFGISDKEQSSQVLSIGKTKTKTGGDTVSEEVWFSTEQWQYPNKVINSVIETSISCQVSLPGAHLLWEGCCLWPFLLLSLFGHWVMYDIMSGWNPRSVINMLGTTLTLWKFYGSCDRIFQDGESVTYCTYVISGVLPEQNFTYLLVPFLPMDLPLKLPEMLWLGAWHPSFCVWKSLWPFIGLFPYMVYQFSQNQYWFLDGIASILNE